MKNKLICLLVFAFLVAISLSTSSSNEQSSKSTIVGKYNPDSFHTNVLVRINTTDGQIPLPRDVEIVGGKPGEWIDVILPQYKLLKLMNAEINYSVLIWDVESYIQTFRGEYHTLAEMEDILEDIAEDYPDITSLYSIGTTYEDRDIWCLEITDNPGEDEGEPGVLFMGLHHAREWPTVEICLYIADELTSIYETDSNITDIVDNRRLWLVTCVNPDGYYYSHDQGNDWRKNRHYLPEFDTYGVDLNRNYAGSCNGDKWGAWGSVGAASVSHNSTQEIYCGPGTISELETQAIRDIFLENNICACISWHTFGELVLWPWSYSQWKETPDNTYLSQVGQKIASKITCQSGSGTYTPQQSAELYPTTGDTTDWAYGYAHYVQGRPTFSYTIEACSSYHPSAVHLDQICEENFDGALYLLQEAENISNVLPRVMPPVIDEMSIDPDGNYTVSWEEQNPDADPDYFQLDELTELSIWMDDGESEAKFWDLEGFLTTSFRFHSSSHSFKTRYGNKDVSAMTTKNPIPITKGMNLSFWCWYKIEKEWDYAFVEVSRDGRCYEVLDKFTGSSSGWVYKEYDLGEYVNESILIRFRYTTDSYSLEEGFYVDDIYPLADFDTINTLSNSIMDNYYKVTNRSEGIYFYRVKGYNSGHEWGDFSTLEGMHVSAGENDPPDVPTINGSVNGKVGREYEYTLVTTDPNGDYVYYYIDWDDGTHEGWIGSFDSGEKVSENHTWSKRGTYLVRAKAKDVHNVESDWATLEVTMPVDKQTIFHRLLERFVDFFPILRSLLGA